MREYRFQADEDSVEQFRRLRGAWRDLLFSEQHVIVRLTDGNAVRIGVELQDIEPGFAANCIVAELLDEDVVGTFADDVEPLDMTELGVRGNDVVLFTGATWLAGAAVESADKSLDTSGMEAVIQQVGTPADIPDNAEARCLTHDAIVIASPTGNGCLIRIASMAGRLEFFTDRGVIAAFLTMRSYRSEDE